MRPYALRKNRILLGGFGFCLGAAWSTFGSKFWHEIFSLFSDNQKNRSTSLLALAPGPSILGHLRAICKPPSGWEMVEKNFPNVFSEGGFEQSETRTIASREQTKMVATGIVSYVSPPMLIGTV